MNVEPSLQVWGTETAANVQKVTWFLRELGLPFTPRGIGYNGGAARDDVYLRVRGGEASPVLKDGDFVLWEGNAIVRYLALRYDGLAFYPEDIRMRADIDRWMDFQLSTIRPPLHALLRDTVDPKAIARHGAKLAEAMEPVEATLAHQKYLAGESFTIGDIPVGINAYRWHLLDIPRPPSPAIDAWLQRLYARPAFAAAIVPPANTSVALRT
jgi:glutathione S-transferase